MASSLPSLFNGAHELPAFERRGLMLDISRNRVPTMDWLKTLIDALARLRYNELQLYTEHTFAYADHKTVWQNASPMTAEEIREIDRYCAEHGIDLVPNQNSFGHMERWLRHAAYKHLAECPDGFEHPISGWRKFGGTLAPTPESAAFIDGLYTKLLPNFSSQFLHVGGDEPWELGQGRSQARVAKEGKHAVYLEFMQAVLTLAEKHGRQAQLWADIVLERPDLVPQLPKTVMPVIWGYEADSPFPGQCRTVAEAGFARQFYVAPGAGNWNSFGGRLEIARANIALAARAGKAHGARGLLLTAWGDNGHHQPWPTLFPSLILAAQAAWGSPTDQNDLPEHIDRIFYPKEATGHGAAICALGKIDALLPQPAPPNSFLHSAYFADHTALLKLLDLTNEPALVKAREALEHIQTDGLDPEIRLGVDLNRCALERCLHAIAPERQRPPQVAQVQELKARFEILWKNRSREGGLSESLGLIDPAKICAIRPE